MNYCRFLMDIDFLIGVLMERKWSGMEVGFIFVCIVGL